MDNKIDTIDNITAVRKIKSNENDEGSDSVIPLTLITDWFVCIYIAARAGPMELPTILNILLIPIVTPVDSRGDDKRITFIAPTAASDNPADNIPKPVEINNSEEWNSNIITKPNVVKAEPKIIGFIDPNLDMMIPDVGPNNKSTIAKGNWTFPVSIAFSPNPTGIGFAQNWYGLKNHKHRKTYDHYYCARYQYLRFKKNFKVHQWIFCMLFNVNK